MNVALLFWMAVQASDPDEATLRKYVSDLAHEEVAVRDKAFSHLKDLPFRNAENLRKIRSSVSDRESLDRLSEVIRHLVRKEGEALYQDGRLKEALLKLAEAEGAADAPAEVQRRIKSAREFLLGCFESTQGERNLLPQEKLKELNKTHGRFALPALIEFLGDGVHNSNAFNYIKYGLGPDSIPALCGYLKGPDGPSSQAICALLVYLGGGEQAVKTLRSVMEDGNRRKEVREQARTSLMQLRVIEDGR